MSPDATTATNSSAADATRVLVTGASTGIGAATTARLIAAGHQVVSLDVKSPPAGVVEHHHCDLSDPAAIDAVVAGLQGPFRSLLNIAGVPGTVPDDVVMRVNLFGLRHLTEAVWDRIADGGTVVNVASIAGNQWKKRQDRIDTLLDTPNFASAVAWWEANGASVGTDPYTFSKEAVVVYTMRLAGKGLARGIRANDVGPGPVETPIFADFTAQVGEEQMAWVVDQIGRAAQPDDIAQALVWLAVGDHRWVNGQHILVDGGFTAGMSARWIDRTTSPAARR
jgi:NAD(P)-dependent dehydrogenase (short-subunit alcohol dehydrogenase family)